MPFKGTKLGDGPTKPQPFSVFLGKHGQPSVRIARKRAYQSAAEITITAGFVLVTVVNGGLLVSGEGVVRKHKDTIAVTA